MIKQVQSKNIKITDMLNKLNALYDEEDSIKKEIIRLTVMYQDLKEKQELLETMIMYQSNKQNRY